MNRAVWLRLSIWTIWRKVLNALVKYGCQWRVKCTVQSVKCASLTKMEVMISLSWAHRLLTGKQGCCCFKWPFCRSIRCDGWCWTKLTARRDATVSVLTNVLSSMLPTDPMRPAIQVLFWTILMAKALMTSKSTTETNCWYLALQNHAMRKSSRLFNRRKWQHKASQILKWFSLRRKMVAAQAEAQKAT